jgi:hypothetical protein
MISQWFDTSGFEKFIDNNPELKSRIEELKHIWMFEFDTKENRHIMNSHFKELVQSYISKRRDDKIDSIFK